MATILPLFPLLYPLRDTRLFPFQPADEVLSFSSTTTSDASFSPLLVRTLETVFLFKRGLPPFFFFHTITFASLSLCAQEEASISLFLSSRQLKIGELFSSFFFFFPLARWKTYLNAEDRVLHAPFPPKVELFPEDPAVGEYSPLRKDLLLLEWDGACFLFRSEDDFFFLSPKKKRIVPSSFPTLRGR